MKKKLSQERAINEKECLEFCLFLIRDESKELIKKLLKATHEERVLFLLGNGFTFEGLDEKEQKELGRLYREEAQKNQMD